jgi:prolyl-tRNA synthetase
MRFNQLFIQTRREAPADLDLRGQQMLVRAGYIQPLNEGLYALLPLGQRSLRRLEARLESELGNLGGVSVDLPLENGTAAVREIARSHLRSYRQLPVLLYSAGWRMDETQRRGGGLLGARASRVLECYIMEHDPVRQEQLSAEIAGSFLGLLRELGLGVLGGEYLTGAGVETGQVWLFPHPAGEETLLQCEECGYSAAPSAARFQRPAAPAEALASLEPVDTPNCKTIAALAQLLGIPESRTAKAVFLTAEETRLVFAMVRGDRDVNLAALRRILGADNLRPATDEEIRAVGAVPGYASPVGLRGARVIVDREIPETPNLVAGANQEGFHLRNVNYGRDYTAERVAEIAQACAGDACPECGEALVEVRGVRLASAQRYSPEYSAAAGLGYIDDTGKNQPPLLESYRFDLTRALGCLAEACCDEKGLRLPDAAAPFPIHIVVLDARNAEVQAAARDLDARLLAAGVEALVDDRPDSPGVKFNDADLIGLPVRLTVSERALKQGGFELKRRGEENKEIISGDRILEYGSFARHAVK